MDFRLNVWACLMVGSLVAACSAVAEEPVLPFQADWSHASLETSIGWPAVLDVGQAYPQLHVRAQAPGRLLAELYRDGERVASLLDETVSGDELLELSLPEGSAEAGRYEARLRLEEEDGGRVYDALHFTVLDRDAIPPRQSRVVHEDEDGRLRYVPDYRGNRILDFSHAGYAGGGQPLPEVADAIVLSPADGDDTQRIQEAIDELSATQPDEAGMRGAILLEAGLWEIAGSLTIEADGIVLRGEGPGASRRDVIPEPPGLLEQAREDLADAEGTILLVSGQERRVVIEAGGEFGREPVESSATRITDLYVPLGSRELRVASTERFEVGDAVLVRRHGNEAWIREIGMADIPPRPGGRESPVWEPFDLEMDRVIEAIEGDRLILDAPVTNAIELKWGGGEVLHYEDGRIENVGIENLRAISLWEPNEDGVDPVRHAHQFCELTRVRNGWVRDLTLEHFFGTYGAIRTGMTARWITIQDCEILVAGNEYYSGPGYESRRFLEEDVYVGRYGVRLHGQQTLAQRNYTIHSRHAFTVSARVAGLNVFLDSLGRDSLTPSQAHFRWSVGGLYDNVADEIALHNRLWYGSSHGWGGANYVAWNTEGILICQQPPTAQNWAIGHVGERDPGPHAEQADLEDGYWESHNMPVRPRSLYVRQLQERLGRDAVRTIGQEPDRP